MLQVVVTYVKPRHPDVIDTFDTWHCIRAIVKGAGKIFSKVGISTSLKGLKEYMKILLVSLLGKYPNDMRKVTREWICFNWNDNGFSFSSTELEYLFEFQRQRSSAVMKLSNLATSSGESYNNHNLVHFGKKVAYLPSVWKLKCLCAWFEWNQVPQWYEGFKNVLWNKLQNES